MKLKNSLLLLLTATIWGVAFVAQSAGMDYMGPFTFNFARCIIGGLVLIPLIFMADRRTAEPVREKENTKLLAAGGVCCGVALCLASNFQQFGIQYTTVGKAGFITSCYIVIVPVLGLFFRKRCSPLVWVAVLLSVVGLYRLCMTGGDGEINRGDLLVLVCAFLFSIHILVIDHFSPMVDCVKMSCIQFLVSGLLSGVAMLIWEKPEFSQFTAAWAPVLYAGVMSCGVGYTLQIVGQKSISPTVASLILSLEASISVVAGWAILGQRMDGQQIQGCVIMFAAIILAQIPVGSLRSARRKKSKPVGNIRLRGDEN